MKGYRHLDHFKGQKIRDVVYEYCDGNTYEELSAQGWFIGIW